MPIRVKRVYASPARSDGTRYLVDRVWPRGVKKNALSMEAWLKELGPSDALRKWFGHDPARWSEFKKRYFKELADKKELWGPLLTESRQRTVTLLFSARDEQHNQAVALRDFLQTRRNPR